ncbi:transposase, partial [Escherichia coli]|uniref:transposase n=1 Tax=Escherichia coli TaxID=562 RepID=UPI002FF343C8
PDIAVRYYYKGVLWSPGYFASSCGGAPISVIRQYIEQQQTPGQVENRTLYPISANLRVVVLRLI